jgi:hypothetical protein
MGVMLGGIVTKKVEVLMLEASIASLKVTVMR